MDLKKEIKLSDLFRRRAKPEAELAAPAPAPSGDAEKKSLLKRDLKLSFRRPKPAAEAVAATEAVPKEKKSGLKRDVKLSLGRKGAEAKTKKPKEPKEPKDKGARRKKGAAPLPEVPLMRAFNLLPKEEGRGQGQSSARRPSTPQLGIAVAGLVLLAALASIFLITNASLADKERRYDELRGQVAAKDLAVQEPVPDSSGDATLIQERDARRGALSTALGARIAWDRLLRDLSLVLPEDVWLKSLRGQSAATPDPAQPPPDPTAVAAAGNTFEATGYARRQEDVALLLSRMGVLPEIQSVTLVSATATEVGEEDVVEFTISAVIKSQGQAVTP